MTTPEDGELSSLREQFPHWAFGVHWQAGASGPDGRSLFAVRDDVVLSAGNAAGLAEQIREKAPPLT